jgi:hypothetical protein
MVGGASTHVPVLVRLPRQLELLPHHVHSRGRCFLATSCLRPSHARSRGLTAAWSIRGRGEAAQRRAEEREQFGELTEQSTDDSSTFSFGVSAAPSALTSRPSTSCNHLRPSRAGGLNIAPLGGRSAAELAWAGGDGFSLQGRRGPVGMTPASRDLCAAAPSSSRCRATPPPAPPSPRSRSPPWWGRRCGDPILAPASGRMAPSSTWVVRRTSPFRMRWEAQLKFLIACMKIASNERPHTSISYQVGNQSQHWNEATRDVPVRATNHPHTGRGGLGDCYILQGVVEFDATRTAWLDFAYMQSGISKYLDRVSENPVGVNP